ncbi:MAG: hypothetical protein Rsou_0083 [Candidatus Ruthia sp. Asou_11_S2]|nr:hypothetical protein [Candidatus Ruthia sp. Asou_11_S2]
MSQIHKHLLAESSLSTEAIEIQHQAYLGSSTNWLIFSKKVRGCYSKLCKCFLTGIEGWRSKAI